MIVFLPTHTKFLSAIHKACSDLLADFSKPKYYPTLDPEKSVRALLFVVLAQMPILTLVFTEGGSEVTAEVCVI